MSGNDDTRADGQGNEHPAVGCHYGGHISMMTFIKENKDKIREAPSGVNISCVSYHDPFLQGMDFAFCVWLEDNDGDCHDTIEVGV